MCRDEITNTSYRISCIQISLNRYHGVIHVFTISPSAYRPHTALSCFTCNSTITHHTLYSGRRRLCLMFCVTYSLTCGLLLVPSLPVLLLGRVLGGISTSILFSAFESWLVSASSTAALHSEDLSAIMGRATLVNGFVAAAAGVRPLFCRFTWCAYECV